MSEQVQEKQIKVKAQQSNRMILRISRETGKKLLNVLSKINKKDFGKRVKPDHLILELLSFVTDDLSEKLRKNSLSNEDLLEMKFKDFVGRRPGTTKDEFLGLLLSGEVGKLS